MGRVGCQQAAARPPAAHGNSGRSGAGRSVPAGAAASGGLGGSSGGIWTEAYPAPPSRIRSLLLVYPKLHRRPHESSCSFAAGLIARSCNPTRRRFSQVFKRLCTSVLIGPLVAQPLFNLVAEVPDGFWC